MSHTAAPGAPWFAYTAPKPQARVTLFCLPYAGGSAAIYRTWVGAAPPALRVVPVELPGRGRRFAEPPFTDIAALVEPLAQALLPLAQQPFALFGHSMGALIGFELARRLQRGAAPMPARLFVSGSPAPQLPPTRRDIHDLPEDEFEHELRQLNGTPEEVLANAELMQLVAPLLRADFKLCETYRCAGAPLLACPISAFSGADDAEAGAEQMRPWREHTAAEFTLRQLPGDHFFLNAARDRMIQAIVQDLGLAY